MARKQAAKPDANTLRIAEWLAGRGAELEHQGLAAEGIAAAVGMPEAQVKAALDHLEDREVVVRMPHPLASPPQTLLKAGRAWPEMRDEILKK
jgi:hypothetical protein